MSGHSHWAGIKHKKEITDQKRGQVFSKLLAAIAAAAKKGPNPEFNPRLRTAVEKARENSVPAETINRAIKRASENAAAIEELLFEAYGAGGTALLIEATSDNKNRTVAEVKKILSDSGGKFAEEGGVRWAFVQDKNSNWAAKFTQPLTGGDKAALQTLIAALESHDDVQKVWTNIEGL